MALNITNDGSYILKKTLKESELENIKKELNIIPKVTVSYGPETKVETFNIFAETNDKIYIPRCYGLKKFTKIINTLKPTNPVKVNFIGELRDYQKDIINIALPKIKSDGGGLLSIPTGRGKTVIGLHLATLLKCRTLIVVHKEFLMNQWIERIKQYTNASIGKIQQNKIDVDKDFVVGMLQSISMIDYEIDMFKKFDFVIFDECHHLSAKVFSQALLKINCPYLLGLSATPNRSDKTEKVFYYFLGEMIYQEQIPLKHKVKVEAYNYSIKHKKFREVIGKNGKSIDPILVSNLVEIEERDDYIYKLILDLKEKEPSRKILVLSGRKVQLERLNILLKKVFEGDTGFYIGGMKEADLKISESKDILLATYEMVTEGLDIQALDTMILCTPKYNIVQTVGRILRKKPEDYENQPLVIDIVDQLPACIFMGMTRKKVYTSRNYEITYHEVKDNKIIKTWDHDYTKDRKSTKTEDIGFVDTDGEDEKPKKTDTEFIDSEKEEVSKEDVSKEEIVKPKRKPRAKKVEVPVQEVQEAFNLLENQTVEPIVPKRRYRKKKDIV
jgi:superfamily II DNA or RNA helicase